MSETYSGHISFFHFHHRKPPPEKLFIGTEKPFIKYLRFNSFKVVYLPYCKQKTEKHNNLYPFSAKFTIFAITFKRKRIYR